MLACMKLHSGTMVVVIFFCAVKHLISVWRADEKDVLRLRIRENCEPFSQKYDTIQQQINKISVLDELLAGMGIYNNIHQRGHRHLL